ncbi:MAG: ABC transporter ATP-binding protein [Planctomycetes bacterium]|nr:ABC transporter ATP-binding protein [Planctomycetota bacterium]
MVNVPLIELRQVTHRFGDADEGPLILNDVSLAVAAGDTLAIVGPSGSGKSTLLNILGTLLRPTSGGVWFQGNELAGDTPDALAMFRNRTLGFVFQAHHLLPQCTALENALVPTLVLEDADARRSAPERARQLLERVGLKDRMHARPARLSGGECQRVALVRALINEPQLVLADEPTGSLDHASAEAMAELLVELNRERGLTMVCVTHSLALAERMQTTRELRDGTLHALEPTS